MNIYVGNLSYNVTDTMLHTIFGEFGKVMNINLIKDKYTGQSKGFCFVEMEKQSAAEEAVKKLNGRAVDGRNITVNLARPRGERTQSKQRRW
ncbi:MULTISPECIES: RNA recognition motif domain-containing protein [Nitrosomonas]|uniref:RNA recognition motif-containing protein n=1 Tax=Nitrosomonas communis TaxID=44574 RepID=A0A0F7KF10_9PROT|nr:MULTISPECIES: RNA-binding protein [Nitrosomonas]AKH38071.1 RNA-binding protein [Nitrosomonas communis]TYP88162.1 RNA recognition motif-containing protein [Nitrosomonas communis]UVS59971.1 RNA-binding protein [Nitrosomonas sp. PLL12]SDW91827.1 RNA recognition motif. (a.k.a. RRM, RBD, or RNP domain) [Nitrosomonas communis]